ncbi:MAG: tripartite tricarboxylate transporter permease [Candidatus Woesearchaeota archaeon]
MFLEILLAILLGVVAGCFTGLIPGIHTNLIAVMLVSIANLVLEIVSINSLIAFIIAMSITHSFTNTIPSIYLGAPEPSTALNVLPGHKLLMDGEGLNAVKLTLLGSMMGLIVCFVSYPLLKWFILLSYEFLSNNIPLIMLVVAIFLITRTKDWKNNTLIYISAAIIGVLVLNSKMQDPLFPMLSGFFGISTLLFSLKTNSSIPTQKKDSFNYKMNKFSLFLGTISGYITAILPGLGSSTAAAISSSIKKENETKDFLFMMGSISTVNFFMSIAALSAIDKGRNGSIVAIMSLTNNYDISLMIAASIISAGIAIITSRIIAKYFEKIALRLNYAMLVKSVIILIIILTVILTGIIGLIVLFASTTIGLYSNIKSTPRNLMMSSIMVPISLFFLV